MVELSADQVWPLVVSPGNNYVFVATTPDDGRGAYILWHLKEKVAVAELPQPAMYRNDLVDKAAFSPDEQLLAYGAEDYTMRIWNVAEDRHYEDTRGT